jgi:uncharacterized protein YggU (UPF0235/DUF167 family)
MPRDSAIPSRRPQQAFAFRAAFARHADYVPCTLALKTIPNAPRDEIAGWLGDALKVKVHAPALEQLQVPRRDLTLLQGAKSRQKVIRIASLDAATLRTRLP